LLSEHLAWIDSEIAREVPPPPASPALTAPAGPITPPPVHAASLVIPTEADELIEKYAAQERQSPDDIRRGCLYVFISAGILLTAGVAAVWLLFYR
jgi:hypothetical protein